MFEQILKSEIAAQRRQIRKIFWVQIISDVIYVLILSSAQLYQELLLLLLFQIPVNLMTWRLSIKTHSLFKAPLILLQNLVFFTFALILGEKGQVQLLFLSGFLSHVLHFRPKRWVEWAAVGVAPVLWNILEWHNYSLWSLQEPVAAWVVTAVRFTLINTSFVFCFLIFDFLRLRYLETQNELLASSLNLRQAKSMIERQQSVLVQNSKMQALGEMAGGIAHEINNPLSIIEAQLYTLKKKMQKSALPTEEILDFIQGIEQTCSRISQIIQGLLEISGDGTRDPFKPMSVLSILTSAQQLCLQRFQHHGIDLVFDKNIPETLQIQCRQSQIGQVLLNLLSNAFDAVAESPERWVRVWTLFDAEHVMFIVSDSGTGISAQQRERLFQPFSTTKPIGKGIGLGLSISKGIIEQHKGNLWLDSSATFTTFKIELPLLQPEV